MVVRKYISATCAISGGIHKPIHRPALPIGASPFQGHRRQACRLAWWESLLHTLQTAVSLPF